MKTAISLPDDLFEAAERLASRRGLSRSAIYALALREYLRGHDDEAVTKKLDEVYRDDPGHLPADLLAVSIAALTRDEW